MDKKYILRTFLCFLNLFALFLFSCSNSNEDLLPAAPTVALVHLGTHDSPDDKIVLIGEAIHLEADIVASGLVAKIELEAYQTSGYGTYSFKKEYTGDYVGQKEVTYHDHPELSDDAPIGEYRLIIKVTDQKGQVGKVESDFTVKQGDGSGEHTHEH
ncbi:DUF4625 domain-containing protein [Sphingobacterium sp. LRF_L2]|uniref:DUF4625 domain-containing protein n=1 Tax=Sphingobacterium sp. LRF_L2 TaxID=3369421 RepID=UPI003F5E82EE